MCSAAHRQVARVFDFFHHRVGARFAHTRELPLVAPSKVAVSGHVGAARFEQVIKASGISVRLARA